ncbi:MAG: DUF4013 domain-containing protein [Treponema sp.]|jgi:hypothetical protein|nr:DUF4013 domain-containing protein [Treponema sp.]
MQGKIFAESMNLYQDQAKILFDYYKKAAEKIVKEEMDLEKSIEKARSEITLAWKNKKKGILIIVVFPVLALIFGLVLPVATGLFGDYGYIGYALALGSIGGIIRLVHALESIKENESKIRGFEEAHRDIRRNYRVKKIGVAYVPIATKVPFENKSFLVDHTGAVQDTDFSMSVVRKPEDLLVSLSELEKGIKEAPVIEQASAPEEIDTADYSTSMQRVTMYDYMGNIDRQVRNIRYLLHDNDTVALSLPVVLPQSQTAEFIKEYAASDPEDKPVVPVYTIDGFKEKIDTFYALNEVKKNFEKNTNENQIEYFKKLIRRLAESVQILSRTKISGSNKVIDYANMIFSTVLKSAFNQYSPALEAEEIERIRLASFDYQDSVDDYTPFSLKSSSRVKYDLLSTAWIAEDQSRTSMPFGMHQIQEEVLAPVIQNLMAENRVERLKIYNNIKDQKIDYLNQWHRDTEDFYGRNRAESADLINRMREAYADYIRSFHTYKALQETQEAMNKTHSLDSAEVHEQHKNAEVIAGFEVQAAQFNQKQMEFSDYMDRLKEDIDRKAAEFGYIPYYEAALRDQEYRDMARSTVPDQLQELDPRRKKLIAISPYVAKFAQLPPAPRVEQQMYDDFSIDLIREASETEAAGNSAPESPPGGMQEEPGAEKGMET